MSGVLIGDKHTERDWGLIWTDVEIGPPEAQTKYLEIPGRDGALDLTDVLGGGLKYKNRSITNGFVLADRNAGLWHDRYSEILNYCQGKYRKVTLDSDPAFYYLGRLSVTSEKKDAAHSIVTISCNAEPYKYEINSSLEDWLWDPFSFETGIIRNYKNIQVSGSKAIVILGRAMPVPLRVTVSTVMTVSYKGKSYSLAAGENRPAGLILGEGENELTFTGNGTVSIDYRGGSL